MSKFEIFEDKAGEFRFRLRARNGKIVAVSESYPSVRNARRGIVAVIGAVQEGPAVVVLK